MLKSLANQTATATVTKWMRGNLKDPYQLCEQIKKEYNQSGLLSQEVVERIVNALVIIDDNGKKITLPFWAVLAENNCVELLNLMLSQINVELVNNNETGVDILYLLADLKPETNLSPNTKKSIVKIFDNLIELSGANYDKYQDLLSSFFDYKDYRRAMYFPNFITKYEFLNNSIKKIKEFEGRNVINDYLELTPGESGLLAYAGRNRNYKLFDYLWTKIINEPIDFPINSYAAEFVFKMNDFELVKILLKHPNVINKEFYDKFVNRRIHDWETGELRYEFDERIRNYVRDYVNEN